jgi:carbon-monoxide dehydrogenase medium subunit
MSGTYAAPQTIKDAVALLSGTPGARVLAGGQRLLVEPSRSRVASALLVDLRRIGTLAGIERTADGGLKIGAMTTLAAIAASGAVRGVWPVLADAARSSGDAQLRNRATIGGSVASAVPDADLPPVLLALDATLEVAGASGSRTVELKDLYTGPGETALAPHEIITAVVVPPRAGRTDAVYEKFEHPATLGALCGVAARVTLDANGTVAAARVALTGATDRPVRVPKAEAALAGQQPTDAALAAAAGGTKDAGVFLGDHFGSAEYRRHLARVLTERALKRAKDGVSRD